MNTMYIAASGLVAQGQALQMIGGNLANRQSTGFLPQVPEFMPYPAAEIARVRQSATPIGVVSQGVALGGTLDMTASGTEPTGLSTDLAVVGNGFFTVRLPNGQTAWTRNGRFGVDGLGRLVDSQGDLVLGTTGQPLTVGSAQFAVSPTGVVTNGGGTVGTLALADLSPTGLVALGGNRYQGTPQVFNGTVTQGAINTSGVSAVQSATQLIQAQSAYQALTTVMNEESLRLSQTVTLGTVA